MPAQKQLPEVQEFGTLAIDRRARTVRVDGRDLDLTRAEYSLLAALAARAGEAQSSHDLLRAMWESDWTPGIATLHTHVSRLRTKLGESAGDPHFIHTVKGFGYRFEAGPARPVGGSTDVVAHCVVDPQLRILWVGHHIERVLGWQARDLTGRTLDELTLADAAAGLAESIAGVRAESPVAFETYLVTAAGDYRRIAMRAQAIASGPPEAGRTDDSSGGQAPTDGTLLSCRRA